MSAVEPLTAAQMEILEFERLTWKYQAVKDTAVLTRFRLSPHRYRQLVNDVLALPAAEVYDPELVRRLRRLRDDRQRARGARSIGYPTTKAREA